MKYIYSFDDKLKSHCSTPIMTHISDIAVERVKRALSTWSKVNFYSGIRVHFHTLYTFPRERGRKGVGFHLYKSWSNSVFFKMNFTLLVLNWFIVQHLMILIFHEICIDYKHFRLQELWRYQQFVQIYHDTVCLLYDSLKLPWLRFNGEVQRYAIWLSGTMRRLELLMMNTIK